MIAPLRLPSTVRFGGRHSSRNETGASTLSGGPHTTEYSTSGTFGTGGALALGAGSAAFAEDAASEELELVAATGDPASPPFPSPDRQATSIITTTTSGRTRDEDDMAEPAHATPARTRPFPLRSRARRPVPPMATQPNDDDERPIHGLADLVSVFEPAEKPADRFRIGVEAEKFGVHAPTGAPISYDGARSVTRIFDALTELGWQPERESEKGPVLALRRNGASITLEPGSQLELSGAALPDLHAARAEFVGHLGELRPISEELELAWLGVG